MLKKGFIYKYEQNNEILFFYPMKDVDNAKSFAAKRLAKVKLSGKKKRYQLISSKVARIPRMLMQENFQLADNRSIEKLMASMKSKMNAAIWILAIKYFAKDLAEEDQARLHMEFNAM